MMIRDRGRPCGQYITIKGGVGAQFIAPNTHQPKDKPITFRRGEGGGERMGGPSWSPASCCPGSHLGGT